jgi:hypothetical protein
MQAQGDSGAASTSTAVAAELRRLLKRCDALLPYLQLAVASAQLVGGKLPAQQPILVMAPRVPSASTLGHPPRPPRPPTKPACRRTGPHPPSARPPRCAGLQRRPAPSPSRLLAASWLLRCAVEQGKEVVVELPNVGLGPVGMMGCVIVCVWWWGGGSFAHLC